MARKLTVLSFISALVFSFFAFEGAFGLNEKLRENHNSDTDNFYNEVLADQHSSLLFPILACISIYLLYASVRHGLQANSARLRSLIGYLRSQAARSASERSLLQ